MNVRTFFLCFSLIVSSLACGTSVDEVACDNQFGDCRGGNVDVCASLVTKGQCDLGEFDNVCLFVQNALQKAKLPASDAQAKSIKAWVDTYNCPPAAG